jgi:predicted Zn-dependent peptidase
VHAGYQSLRTQGMILGYAGTVPERAQRTLDSFIHELKKIRDGISADELERARIGIKSRVVMNGESSSARAGALLHDMYHLGRPRSLDELRRRVEAPTLTDVNDYLCAHPVERFTLLTIGPAELTTPN